MPRLVRARNDNARPRRRVISGADLGNEMDLQRAVREATEQIEEPAARAAARRALGGLRRRVKR